MYSVISCGEENPPSEGTENRLREAGAGIYRTDQMESIVVTSNGTDIAFCTPMGDMRMKINIRKGYKGVMIQLSRVRE